MNNERYLTMQERWAIDDEYYKKLAMAKRCIVLKYGGEALFNKVKELDEKAEKDIKNMTLYYREIGKIVRPFSEKYHDEIQTMMKTL